MDTYRAVFLDKVSSTNDVVSKLLKSGIEPPIVVSAKRQKSGRGRYKRRWHSEKGGLYTSFGFYEDGFIFAQKLNILSSLAVIRTIDKISGVKVDIKLPNDLLLDGKKLCGILTESKENFCIVGIGININQTKFPEELRDKATSLRVISGKDYKEEDILFLLIEEMEIIRKNIIEDYSKIFEEWRNEFSDINKKISFVYHSGEITGTLLDVTPELELLCDIGGDTLRFPIYEIRDVKTHPE